MCMYMFRFMSILVCLLGCIQLLLSNLECFCIVTVSTEHCKLVTRNYFLEDICLMLTELWAFIDRQISSVLQADCTATYLTVPFWKKNKHILCVYVSLQRHDLKSLNSQYMYLFTVTECMLLWNCHWQVLLLNSGLRLQFTYIGLLKHYFYVWMLITWRKIS